MPPPPPEAPPTFVLSSRALRFRVVAGDETGYAVTRFVGLGGAVLKASVVPPVGARIRLMERYGVRGVDVHIDAKVIAAIPEPDLSGRDPGFCVSFDRITVRGDRQQLLDFIEVLDPGYAHRHPGRDDIAPCDDPIQGQRTAFIPRIHRDPRTVLEAAGLTPPSDDVWDDGLEHIAFDVGVTPPPVADSTQHPEPLPAAAAPETAARATPPETRRRGGLGGLLGGLFGRGRSDEPDT